eukprot:m.786708 g.786708  ORF g.786708 m.786708 type:complete len:65 (-) comp23306_c0_seq5:1066-1260(-)
MCCLLDLPVVFGCTCLHVRGWVLRGQGIDEPDDFAMFTEDELVTNHGFKVGHVRKILRALANGE